MGSHYRLVVVLTLMQGCGVTYQLPMPPNSTLIEAANEIRTTPTREPTTVALSSAEKRIGDIERRLHSTVLETDNVAGLVLFRKRLTTAQQYP